MTEDHNRAAETGGAVELLACPFCGAHVRLSSEGKFHQVVCQDCGSKAAEYPNDTLAALAWNTRAPVVSSQAGEGYNCTYCADRKIVGRRYAPDWKLVEQPCC